MKHKHYDVIVAWAEGKPIQSRHSGRGWADWEKSHSLTPGFGSWEWRVKPAVVKYRNYLYRLAEGQYVVRTAQADFKSEGMAGFVRWIGDWQEVEI